MFVMTNDIISKGNGNLQFNTSTANFREKVQLIYDGIHKMNDKKEYYAECLKTAKKDLELYLKNPIVYSGVVEEKEKAIEDYKTAVSVITKDIRDNMPTYDGNDLNLYNAYVQFCNGEIVEWVYNRAFMQWFFYNGIIPTDKGIAYVGMAFGLKPSKGKKLRQNQTQLTKAISDKAFYDLLYRRVGELMAKANCLKSYTYEYNPTIK